MLNDERVLLERRQRIAEVYRAGIPSDAEVERARRRFAARPRRVTSLRRVWAIGLAQGFTAGLVTLAAASFVGAKVLPKLSTFWSSPAVEARLPRADSASAPAVRQAPVREEPAAESAPAVPTARFAEANAPTSAGTPRTDRPRVVAAQPRAVAEPQVAPAAPASAARVPESPSTGAGWTHVAEALAAKDFDRAEASLKGLAESGDLATRDAASLSRAELWIARVHGAAVRQDVERLSREGRTPLIRRRAAELLHKLRGP